MYKAEPGDIRSNPDKEYIILYNNLDDIHLLKFVWKKGIIDFNEVNTNLNYSGNAEKNILPFLNSLESRGYVKPVNTTNFKITTKGIWSLLKARVSK